MARALLLHFLAVVSSTLAQDYYSQTPVLGGKGPPAACGNEFGLPQRCIPEFENAAFGVQMEATNTCGENKTTRYCVQTSAGTDERICDDCQRGQFSSYFLTDLHHESENPTWWQSDTMYEDIQHPTQVNLTLHLGKSYDITYIRIVFYSPRPQSFVIYKRVSEDSEWVPYQYFSQSCRETYGLPESKATDISAETRALCTNEYSDISPLKGGNVLFSTLAGRPSAFNFDSSPQLQEWVTATDIRISLHRLNTFGDEIFKDEQVLRSYWYAIADVAVGARCKCNGHASRCETELDENGKRIRFCSCEHNTAGRDCERCQDYFNDAPWGRASQTNVHECKACNCNGFSNRCFFDKDLYERTGHGGHCTDCAENRDGPNCERCRENFYQREDDVCVPCNCDPTGSRSLQCNSEGKCQCKPGVTGDKCSVCEANHFDFTTQGCKPCGCYEQGSYANTPSCDAVTGLCQCKENVEGKRCGQCKPGFFNLDMSNEFGCTPCFCYGHSSKCDSAPDYGRLTLESQFVRGGERWTAQDSSHRALELQYNANTQNIALRATGNEAVYFVAPERFLGDQRASYNHDLRFNLRLGEANGYPSQTDLVLEGVGKHVSISIFGQKNQAPTNQGVEYSFRLHESPSYGWSPTLSTLEFMSILSNLTAIKIRGAYNRNGVGYLDNFRLETAQRGVAGYTALWVEMCSCPKGYVGQFCESCDPGYRHSPANGGPFTMCIPCDCNHHASICDSETGMCICEHNTAGDNCELCAKGFYGNAITGTADDCKPCPCPNNSACMQMMDQSIVCTECPTGYAGIKCDLCSDGNFGDPTGRYGEPTPCTPCDCNTNVDLNAVGNCNRTTGECLKCIYNTAGDHCDRCLNGYYGDALSPTKGDCKPCECYQLGTLESAEGPPQCDPLTGFCHCRAHVAGRNCDKCQPGYFNIMSGDGCEPCNCNFEGSYNNTCDPASGQCYCKPGISGVHCDQCKPYHYGFSAEGCQYCDCEESGSTNYQCDMNGQCSCQENVEGRRCDRCMENKQRRADLAGCEDCPPCYNLVQDAVNQHRRDLDELTTMLSKISLSKTVVKSADFDGELARLKEDLAALRRDAEGALGAGEPLADRLAELAARLRHVRELLLEVDESTRAADLDTEESQQNIKQADEIIAAARTEFSSAEEYLAGEGAAALARAQNRSSQFGQQSTQMSRVAQESRLLAEKLEKEARKVAELAESAYNTSRAANELAKDGMTKQSNIRAELQILESEIKAAKGKLNNVRDIAQQAKNRSEEVYDKALDAYVRVNTTQLPAIDAKSLQNNATMLMKKADELQGMIDNLLEQYEDSLSELDKQLGEGRLLKDQGREREVEIQEIIAILDDIKVRALGAVEETNSTLQDAYKIHNTLKNFSMQVHASREAAEAESRSIPAVEQRLAQAEDTRGELDARLRAAGDSARAALDVAERAREQFAAHAVAAAALRRNASAGRGEALELRDEAQKLSGRVDLTAVQIDNLTKMAEESGLSTNDANIKVASAKKDAEEAQRLVRQATEELRGIQEELDNVQELDDEALDNLEKNLERAEEELRAADLASKIEKLQAAKTVHLKSLKEYQENAATLKSQVNNVKDIMEALPEGCFKKVILEPS